MKLTKTNQKIDDNICRALTFVCEDALNIVDSDFIVQNSTFINIYSDAFDSDFSNGEVINCTFTNVKNDAIDFSGSVSTILNCNITDIKDKAISAGEKSTLTVKNTSVKNVNIAFASKDKSKLIIENSNINTAKYAFASYIKKNEFGASKLIAKSISLNNVEENILIDKNCTISIDDNIEIGKKDIDVDKLYENFKK